MQFIENIIQGNIAYFLAGMGLILAVILVWNIWLQIQLSGIKKKNRQFFSGNKVKNLEELLLSQARNLKMLDKDIQELYGISNQINSLALKGFHKLGVIRFNPFKDVGGNQSFSIALLNGKNNGLTISSLFTREGARIYTKTITAGISEKYPLTEEEQDAIRMAMSEK